VSKGVFCSSDTCPAVLGYCAGVVCSVDVVGVEPNIHFLGVGPAVGDQESRLFPQDDAKCWTWWDDIQLRLPSGWLKAQDDEPQQHPDKGIRGEGERKGEREAVGQRGLSLFGQDSLFAPRMAIRLVCIGPSPSFPASSYMSFCPRLSWIWYATG